MTPGDLLAYFDHLPDHPPLELLERRMEALAAALAASNGDLSSLQRHVLRSALIERLKSLHVSGASALVDAALRAGHDGSDTPQGHEVTPVEFAPALELVDGAILLKDLAETFERYIALSSHASTALALGVVLSHGYEATEVLPLLALVSPTKRCGKSTVLMLASALVQRSLLASNITPAATFRIVEKYRPTLLLDEADTAFRVSDELRTLYNAGHTRPTAIVPRTVGDDHEPRLFSVFCPKWLALIGELPSTLMDRAVVVPMQRRPKGATTARLRLDRLGQFRPQAERIARWAADHLDALKAADPNMPEDLHDRAQDNWRPLIAIADLAGGIWPAKARDAALALSGETDEQNERGIMLLTDLRGLFDRRPDVDQLATMTLLTDLANLEERPWADYSRSKPLTARQLGRLLRPFKVESRTLRLKEVTFKGYRLADLAEAFERYIPSTPPKTTSQSVTSATSAESLTEMPVSHPSHDVPVTDEKQDLSAGKDRDVADVTDRNPENGGVDRKVCPLNPDDPQLDLEP